MPPALQSIVSLFAGRSDAERRELLLHFAAGAGRWSPRPGESFDIENHRQDEECADRVGLHVSVAGGACRVRVTLGPEVQTLTRALAAVLCEGLEGAMPEEVAALPESVVEDIAGQVLVRLRSRTAYYILRRVKQAVQAAWTA